MLSLYDLKTEGITCPALVDAPHPSFSWKLRSDRSGVRQASCRVRVYSGDALLYDSGIVETDESARFRYEGPALPPAEVIRWEVTVSDGIETASASSTFETAPVQGVSPNAIWIEPEGEIDPDARKPSPRLRREFTVRKGLVRARAYQSAHGLYRAWFNGVEGSRERFTPGITSYYFRIQYQMADITALLHTGANCWAVRLGDGWWRGYTGGGNRNNFGFRLGFWGALMLDYEDGTREIIPSDTAFTASTGAILRCDMKVGEIYDARIDEAAWLMPGFDDSAWQHAHPAKEHPETSTLIPSRSVPVLEQADLDGHPFTDAAGNTVIDFQQNHAGYVTMVLRNTVPGQTITLWHGEGLLNGTFSTKNIEDTIDDPFQQVVYICRGAETETYTPSFSIFGFRYVKLEGYDASLIREGDFTSHAVWSALEDAGSFSCSNPLIDRLVLNSLWSQRSNFLDAPTDCPTRERSVWSGDSEVYCKTSADFMNVAPFFTKWLKDMCLEQFESGCVGNTCPSTSCLHNTEERQRMIDQGRFVFAPPEMAGPAGDGSPMDGSAGWGDMATIDPYTMYLCYGDEAFLRDNYDAAKKWMEFCRRNAKDRNPLYADAPVYQNGNDGDYFYDTHFHWGEWLEPDSAENGGPTAFDPLEFARRGNPVVATAYLYHSADLLSKMAGILGYQQDAAEYAAYAKEVKRVYNRYLIAADGTVLPGRQAAQTRVLAFGIADEEKAPLVAARLAEDVAATGYTINTGFLSTPLILRVLVDHGYSDLAYRLLEQTKSPSWLHAVTLGATTITENWAGLDTYQGSFNHYSYGAVCDFLFCYTAGIRPDEEHPGYRHFILAPVPGGSLTHAEARRETPYGTILSSWEKTPEGITYRFTVPANTTATLRLPGMEEQELSSGEYTFSRNC